MIPYGNYSYMKVLTDDKVLPLYGSGGFRMIFDTKVGVDLVDITRNMVFRVRKIEN